MNSWFTHNTAKDKEPNTLTVNSRFKPNCNFNDIPGETRAANNAAKYKHQ